MKAAKNAMATKMLTPINKNITDINHIYIAKLGLEALVSNE